MKRRTMKNNFIKTIVEGIAGLGLFLAALALSGVLRGIAILLGIMFTVDSGYELIGYGIQKFSERRDFRKDWKQRQQEIKMKEQQKNETLSHSIQEEKTIVITQSKSVPNVNARQTTKTTAHVSYKDDELSK